MLVYQATKAEFMDDVEHDVIVDHITRAFESRIHRANPGEVRSWQNSMQHMYKVLNTAEIPGACGVAIEFGVPYTNSRIDFLLTGSAAPALPEPTYDAAVIIELKQWDKLEAVDGKEDLVRTFVGGGNRVVTHPSYQAWSYARMIEDYNEAVRKDEIVLLPCAYLHNYHAADPDPLFDDRYSESLAGAPAFCAGDVFKLRAFICRHISRGDDGAILYRIESGRLKPSKSLQDALSGMLEGNNEFVMIDDQKVVLETALDLARKSRADGKKRVMIVRGGPGTGKSVVAVNLLVRLTAEDMVVQYVSKNSAPRNVYSRLLRARKRTKSYIDNLFRGSGNYYDLPRDSFDALVVDEAHRLNVKSGLYGNLGDNQTRELIDAARFSVFFIDECQRVTLKDAGNADEIRSLAAAAGAQVEEMELASQFRCNGSDSYLEWLDDALGIHSAADPDFTDFDYDFRVFDDPNELMTAVVARNTERNKARVVAGYCWEWPTKTRGSRAAGHVAIPEHGFARSWNLDSSPTWAIDDDSVEQIGCVHTAQGLEFDYVGVIIGDDMRFEDDRVITDRSERAKTDASLNGIGPIAKVDPVRADQVADEIIRNTYRVLMTRGMKGCYVYCTDPALGAHLRSVVPRAAGVAYSPAAVRDEPIAAEDPLED